MRKSSIRKKVQAIVLYISVIALIITGAVGIFGMRRIQDDSKAALTSQMEQHLENITDSQKDLAESELGKYAGYARNFADYIHGMYASSRDYVPREVLPSRIENTGVLAMQRILAPSADERGR